MKKLSLIAAVALAVSHLGATSGVAATPEQLNTVAQLARSHAMQELVNYVAANPELTAADSPIASMLLDLLSRPTVTAIEVATLAGAASRAANGAAPTATWNTASIY